MNKFIAPLLFVVSFALAQSNWSDFFADMHKWHGDTAVFFAQNGLFLNDTAANQIAIYRFSSAVDSATWRFSLGYDFMPSSTNHASFCLMSDVPDFWGASNGYFVRVGGGAQRTIALVRRTGNSNAIILESANQFLATPHVQVEVEVHRSLDGQWTMRVDTSSNGGAWINIGTVRDTVHTSSYFSGFFCRYTITRADKMFFGFVEVTSAGQQDAEPPRLLTHYVEDPLSVVLHFDKALDVDSAEVNIDGQPCLLLHDIYRPTELVVMPHAPLEENVLLEMVLEQIKSRTGVVLPRYTAEIVNRKAAYNDLVVNELMVNPTPGIGVLPEVSYIELYNASDLPVPLRAWQLQINQSHRTLPNVDLGPGEYLLLVREGDEGLFSSSIRVKGVSMATNALTNAKGEVYLYDDNNRLIDAVIYSDQWYGDQVKRGGGWSLERIDAYASCGAINWRASQSSMGGTPGLKNSVASELELLVNAKVTHWGVKEGEVLEVYFNLDVQSNDAKWYLNDVELELVEVAFNTVQLRLSEVLQQGKVYRLEYRGGLIDCLNRAVSDTLLNIVAPQKPESGDLLINEVLPAPFSGGVSFVEIINASDRYIDVNGINMGRWLEVQTTDIRRVVHSPRVLMPGGLLVFTPSVDATTNTYTTHRADVMIEVALPQLPNEHGGVALLSANGELLDAMTYDASMHSPFVRDYRGISLERIGLERESHQRSNWTSASEQIGWATPGVVNSQSLLKSNQSHFSVSPEVFRMRNADLLQVGYELSEAGGVGTLQIFSASGQHIATPINNELLQQTGTLHWNGRSDREAKVAPGLYVVVLEVLTPQGKRKLFKDAFAVVY